MGLLLAPNGRWLPDQHSVAFREIHASVRRTFVLHLSPGHRCELDFGERMLRDVLPRNESILRFQETVLLRRSDVQVLASGSTGMEDHVGNRLVPGHETETVTTGVLRRFQDDREIDRHARSISGFRAMLMAFV